MFKPVRFVFQVKVSIILASGQQTSCRFYCKFQVRLYKLTYVAWWLTRLDHDCLATKSLQFVP